MKLFVALRLECVDRNCCLYILYQTGLLSHSVWSAWIEILAMQDDLANMQVALRLECVDRNIDPLETELQGKESHSVWSAWIEIATSVNYEIFN